MKKILILILFFIGTFILTGCETEEEGLTLRIYNWQDYIDEGLD